MWGLKAPLFLTMFHTPSSLLLTLKMIGCNKCVVPFASYLMLTLLLAKQGTSAVNKNLSIDIKKTKVWGPGLNEHATLPARYFFIQPITKAGEQITESLGDNVFTVSVTSATVEDVRYKHTVYGRRDGLYIVVYRLYNTIKDATIEIKYNDKHVAQSPYSLEGPLYHEQCKCPQIDLTKWYKSMGCPESYRQIDEDLSRFRTINNEEIVEKVISRYSKGQTYGVGHYKIIHNKIYSKIYGDDPKYKMQSDNILLSLTRKVYLPDTEFVMKLFSLPLEKNAKTKDLTLLSWFGTNEVWSIALPTYDLTMSTLEMLGMESIDIFSVMGKSPVAWENKTEKAFWRGRDSRQDRLDLVVMSRKYPEIIDAKLTNMLFFPFDEEKLGKLVNTTPFHDFFKFKYQINIDGTVAAFRLPYLLSGDGVVLKQESPFYEHFYKDLKPYKHYIPVRRDLQDLTKQIEWAKENDDKAREISRHAQEFTRKNIDPVNVFCYYVKVLEKYTSLLTAPVSPPEGDQWEVVEQPDGIETECDCEKPVMKHPEQQHKQQQQAEYRQKEFKQHKQQQQLYAHRQKGAKQQQQHDEHPRKEAKQQQQRIEYRQEEAEQQQAKQAKQQLKQHKQIKEEL